jgi:putative protease
VSDPRRTRNKTTAAVQTYLTEQAERYANQAQAYRQALDFTVRICQGEALLVEVKDGAGISGSGTGALVEAARTKALTAEEVREHIARLGGTPYEVAAFKLSLDEGVGLGFAALHAARRAALADYEMRRFFPPDRSTSAAASSEETLPGTEGSRTLPVSLSPRGPKKTAKLSPDIIAVVSSLSAAKSVLNAGATEAHIAAYHLLDAAPVSGIVPVLPRIAHDDELDTYYGVAERFGCAVASTLGQLATCAMRDIRQQAHWSLGLINRDSLDALATRYAPSRLWLSPELSGRQIAELVRNQNCPLGIVAAGPQEVMVTESCVLQNMRDEAACDTDCASCRRRQGHFALRDKKGYCFPLLVDPLGRSHLYNSVPLDLSSALPEILAGGVSALCLNYETALNAVAAREVARFRRAIKELLAGREPKKEDAVVTKGHFFRGVL